MVPVFARTGQPAHLDSEHKSDVLHRDLAQEPLKSPAIVGGAGAQAEVFVDHEDSLRMPSEGLSVILERILARERLAMLFDLLRGGLPNVDDRQSLKMCGVDLGRRTALYQRSLCRVRSRRCLSGHHEAPPLSLRRGLRACGRVPSTLVADPPRRSDTNVPWLPVSASIPVGAGGDSSGGVVAHWLPPRSVTCVCIHFASRSNAATSIIG